MTGHAEYRGRGRGGNSFFFILLQAEEGGEGGRGWVKCYASQLEVLDAFTGEKGGVGSLLP